jgi:hypothetical protein
LTSYYTCLLNDLAFSVGKIYLVTNVSIYSAAGVALVTADWYSQ